MSATNTAASTDDDVKPYIDPLQIGDTCQILWRDGTTHLLASIVERKRIPGAKELVKTKHVPKKPAPPPVAAPADGAEKAEGRGAEKDVAKNEGEKNEGKGEVGAADGDGGEPAAKKSKLDDGRTAKTAVGSNVNAAVAAAASAAKEGGAQVAGGQLKSPVS